MWWPWRRWVQASTLDTHPPRIPDGDTVLRPGQRRYAEILNEPTEPLATVDRPHIVRPYVNDAEESDARRRRWWRA